MAAKTPRRVVIGVAAVAAAKGLGLGLAWWLGGPQGLAGMGRPQVVEADEAPAVALGSAAQARGEVPAAGGMAGMPPQASSVPVDRPIQPVPREATSGHPGHEAFPAGIRVEATVILAAKDGGKAHALAKAIQRCFEDDREASKGQAAARADSRRDAFCQTRGPGWQKTYWDLRKLALEQKVPGAASTMFSDVPGWEVHVTQAQKDQAWRQMATDALSGDDPRAIAGIVLNTYQTPTGLTERELLMLWTLAQDMSRYQYDEFGVRIMNAHLQSPSLRPHYPAPARLAELSKTQPLSEEEMARVRAIIAKVDRQRTLPLDRRP